MLNVCLLCSFSDVIKTHVIHTCSSLNTDKYLTHIQNQLVFSIAGISLIAKSNMYNSVQAVKFNHWVDYFPIWCMTSSCLSHIAQLLLKKKRLTITLRHDNFHATQCRDKIIHFLQVRTMHTFPYTISRELHFMCGIMYSHPSFSCGYIYVANISALHPERQRVDRFHWIDTISVGRSIEIPHWTPHRT